MTGVCRTQRAQDWKVHGAVRSIVRGGRSLWFVALSLGLWLVGAGPVAASGRYAAMMIDANTGQVLHADAADDARFPASLTKMMTLYMVFEAVQQGRLTSDARIRMSAEAASVSPSKLGLEPGATISVGDAIKALITKSANDVSVAIAEHLAGDENRFAALMTRRARELGMTSTTFRNAHGLPDRGQVTTARDMLTLSLRLYDAFPSQSRLFATRSFHYGGRTHRNHNTMLDNFAGLEGIKTGYTASSGFNLVASVRRDGKHVLAVVFGGTSAAARNARMRVLLSRGLQQASTTRSRKSLIIASNPVLKRMPVPARRPKPPADGDNVVVAQSSTPAPVAVIRVTPRLIDPIQLREAPAQVADVRQDWRANVRVAGVGSSGASVASQLGMDLAPSNSRHSSETVVRRPSTLAAQASELASGPGAMAFPSARHGGGTPRSEAHVQIGAYGAVAEARQRLAQANQAASRQLAGSGQATPMVHVGGKVLYRARFTGLDPARAAEACVQLRRAGIDCLVARPE